MSYEVFRSDLADGLMRIYDMDDVRKIIGITDTIATKYQIQLQSTDLIVHNAIPDELKYYISSKAIQNVNPDTLKNYFSFIRRFFMTVRKRPDEITATDIRGFLGRYKMESGVVDSTLDNKRVILHSFFEWIHGEGLIRSNPCAHVDPIKHNVSAREPIDRDELEIMRAACRDDREVALVDLLYSTGCRIAEVAALVLSDIDWDKRTVLVRHGKGDKRRITYLNSRALVSLRKYLDSRDDDCEFVFVSKRVHEKHGVKEKALQREIGNIWLRSGLTHKITPHIYRHTAGTLASASGMPIEHVQKFLGHASIKTTMRYVKVFDDDVKNSHKKYAS